MKHCGPGVAKPTLAMPWNGEALRRTQARCASCSDASNVLIFPLFAV